MTLMRLTTSYIWNMKLNLTHSKESLQGHSCLTTLVCINMHSVPFLGLTWSHQPTVKMYELRDKCGPTVIPNCFSLWLLELLVLTLKQKTSELKPVSCSSFKYFVAASLPCMNCFNLYLAYQAKYIRQSRKKILSRYKNSFSLWF